MRKCSVDKCTNAYYAKGYCNKHYQQIYLHGKITYKNSDEEAEARRERMLGNKHSPKPTMFKSKEHIEKMRELNKGNKHGVGNTWSKERKDVFTKKYSGKNSCNWQGGKTSDNDMIRCSRKYREWRTKVFKRDEYTCQKCTQVGGTLNAHHIKSFADFPKLRFTIKNGMTLCKKCHIRFHKKYGKKTTEKQLINYLKEKL